MNATSPTGSFELTLIAATGAQFSDFTPYVASLNHAGTVAFQAALQEGRTGVFFGGGSAGGVTEGVPGFPGRIYSHPDINRRGSLCYYGELASGGQGVYLVREGRWSTVADVRGGWSNIGPLGPTMNDGDRVAFRGDLRSGESGIFCGDGGEVATIATTRAVFSAFGGLPVVNERGTVVFQADRRDGGKGIYVGRGGESVPVAETGERFSDIAAFTSINDQDVVAFAATLTSGGVGVFTASGGRITTVVDGTGPFASIRGALISNRGEIVFAATPRGGELGIYAGRDAVADKVIAVGEEMLGSTVAGFALNPVSVNDVGQMAIRIKLTDERQLIIRAQRRHA